MRLICCLACLTLFMYNALGQSSIDSNKIYIVDDIQLTEKKTTKDYIILRELAFQKGDTLSHVNIESILERSRQNLINTSLFNFVTFTWAEQSPSHIVVSIELKERWYIWPFPIIENADRNFNNWWQNKDFGRLSYGMKLQWNNFRGRNEKLTVLAQLGFEKDFALAYSFPYIDKKRRLGITFISGYSSNREVNYGSEDDKRVFLKNENEDLRTGYYFSTFLSLRKKLYGSHKFSVNYNSTSINDSLRFISDDYLFDSGITTRYWSLGYTFNWDTRDNVSYPLKGSILQFHAFKSGLGLTEDKLNVLSARLLIKNHFPISDRFNFANALIGKANLLDDPPYSLQRGLGYQDFVRGYELYVIDGQNYGLIKNNFKVTLLAPRVKKLKFLPVEKFNTVHYAIYFNLHADVGYVEDNLYDRYNTLSNKIIAGYGFGFDFVTYYDIVFRTEYSFNIEGESGFFLHFKKSI